MPPEQAAIEAYWQLRPSRVPAWSARVFPRAQGPFLRLTAPGGAGGPGGPGEPGGPDAPRSLTLAVGQFGLIPPFATDRVLKFATQNARFETVAIKPSYRQAWQRNQRCIIPAASFDEPCWETGRNVWWRFQRQDGALWGLAGLWHAWTDPATGEVLESYTMLTVNADAHPVMRRMHKPDPKLPPDQQDKRSVVAIPAHQVQQWLMGSVAEATALICSPPVGALLAGPAGPD